jgi:hypothetical protein
MKFYHVNFCLEYGKVESLSIDTLLTKKFERFLINRLSIYFQIKMMIN